MNLRKFMNKLLKQLYLYKNFLKMDNFITRLGGNFFRFLGNTDHLTRGLHLPNMTNYVNGISNTPTEVWDTITNNEWNLYTTTSQLFIVVNKRATMLSNGIFRVKDYKTGEIIENHPLLKLLEKPSPLMNRNEWLMHIAICHDVYGNSVIYKNIPSAISEFPITLMPLPNSDLRAKLTGKRYEMTTIDEIVEYYKLDSINKKFTPSELIHIKTTATDDTIFGLSPLHAIQMELTNIRGAKGFRNVNITKKGALGLVSTKTNPNGIFPLDAESRKDLENQYRKDSGIFDKQTPVKFSPVPVDYQHLAYPIKDSMLFEEVDANMRAIIDLYGLNENIFSKEKGATFSNFKEGLMSAYQDSIIPFAEKICFGINDSMNNFEKGYYVELDYSHIPALQEDGRLKANQIKTQVESLEKLIGLGYSLEEAKETVGLK